MVADSVVTASVLCSSESKSYSPRTFNSVVSSETIVDVSVVASVRFYYIAICTFDLLWQLKSFNFMLINIGVHTFIYNIIQTQLENLNYI